MGSIVVAIPKPTDASRIGAIIRRSGINGEVFLCHQGAELLRMVRERDVHVVICVKKYSDMGFEEIASYLPYDIQMLLLTQDQEMMISSSNITKVLMPFKANDLTDMISRYMPSRYTAKKKKRIRSPEEQEQIDQAKDLLMRKRGMSEPDAFRYLQKNSMDHGRTLLESAQMVLLLEGGE